MSFHKSPQTFVSCVHLKVEDLNQSLIFYQNIIGLSIFEKSDTKASLTANGDTPFLVLEQFKNVEARPPGTTGLYHIAFLLPLRSDLGSFLHHLVDEGIQFGGGDHAVREAVYLNDPDGNGLEVYFDRPRSDWEWKDGMVKMTTERLNVNQIMQEGESVTWLGMPAGTIIGHIHLQVNSLTEAEAFYNKGLGMDVVCRYGSQALFLSTGNYHHHIGLNTWAGAGAKKPSEASIGLHFFSLLFPNEKARSIRGKELKDLGFSVKKEADVYRTEDPSGNQIHLLIPNERYH